MALDILSYSLNKKYTNLVALGLSSAVVDDVNKTITFTLTADGSQHTVHFDQPKDGISVEDLRIDENNHLICIMSDSSEIDAGELPSYEPVLTEELKPTVKPGSVKDLYPVGTNLEDIIRDMLIEKVPPTVTMTLNPSGLLYDITTDKISSLTINATVTKKTNNITKIEYFIDDVLVHTATNATSGGSFPYIYNTEINDTTTIKVKVTDTEGLSSVATKKIEFVPNSYYGIIDASIGEPTEAIIKTLNKKLKTTKAFTYEGITTDWGKVCYCYPKSMGELTSIKDPVNSLNYSSEFSKVTVVVDGIDMLCYVKLEASAADNVTLAFA